MYTYSTYFLVLCFKRPILDVADALSAADIVEAMLQHEDEQRRGAVVSELCVEEGSIVYIILGNERSPHY